MDGFDIPLILIGITCVVSFLAFNNPKLMDALIFWPPAVTRRHDYSRFITYGFVHANFQHLLFNMITLYFFGRITAQVVDAKLGPWGFTFFYLSAIAASIVPTFVRHRDDDQYRSLGASGAISALIFAFILLRPWSMILMPFPMPAIVYAVAYLGYTIWMDRRQTDRVNHSAHLWGALYGVAFLLVIEPRVLPAFFDQLMHPHFGS